MMLDEKEMEPEQHIEKLQTLHKAKSQIVHSHHVDPQKTHNEKLQEELGYKKLTEYERLIGEKIDDSPTKGPQEEEKELNDDFFNNSSPQESPMPEYTIFLNNKEEAKVSVNPAERFKGPKNVELEEKNKFGKDFREVIKEIQASENKFGQFMMENALI